MLVGTFNQKKVLLGAISVILKTLPMVRLQLQLVEEKLCRDREVSRSYGLLRGVLRSGNIHQLTGGGQL